MVYTYFVLIGLLLGGVCLHGLIRRRDITLDEAVMDEYRRAIEKDPNNTGAMELLADSLKRAGRTLEAQELYERTLPMVEGTLSEEKIAYKLKQLAIDLENKKKSSKPYQREVNFCRRCGFANPTGWHRCEQCHAPIALDRYRDALRTELLDRRAWVIGLIYSSIVVAILVAIARVGQQGVQPPPH